MSKEKHGLIGSIIKICMIVIFALIGVMLIIHNSILINKNEFAEKSAKTLAIINLVLGCLLLTSPFFLNKEREGLAKIVKFVMVIVFTFIGVAILTHGALAVAKNWYPDAKWRGICDIILGSLLLTSPYFLKK